MIESRIASAIAEIASIVEADGMTPAEATELKETLVRLGRFALCTAMAQRARLDGSIHQAMDLEGHAQSHYEQLPENCKH